MTRIPPRGRSALLLLPLLSLMLVTWACGFTRQIGAANLKVADVPAAQLRLKIQIMDQFSDEANLLVLPLFFEGPNPSDQVALPQGAVVTCNGTDVTPLSRTTVQLARPCPRQPPGGVYRIAYTDTHGATTTALVPVPAGGSFDFISPALGAAVPIPTNGQLEIRYRAPTPPPNGSLTLDSVVAECSVAQAGCTVSAFPPFSGALASSAGADNVAALAQRVAVATQAPTPKPGATPKPGPTPPAPPPTPPGVTPRPGNTTVPSPAPARGNGFASVTIRNGVGAILLRGDFSGFEAGPGTILLEAEGEETLANSGFADASATFATDLIRNNVTWAA